MATAKKRQFTVQVDAEQLNAIGGDPRDAKLAAGIVNAAGQLQQAIDTAARAGLIVEPIFQRTAGSSADYGSGADTFVCKVQIYRKLI